MMKRLTIPDAAGADAPRGEIKYPPFAASGDAVIPDLPNPSAYWSTTPAVLGTPLDNDRTRFFNRRRVVIGLAIAAGLHALLFIGWWLSPPLRLKAGYAPERWVPVLVIPQPQARVVPAGAAPVGAVPETSVMLLPPVGSAQPAPSPPGPAARTHSP